jgi:hypothetical protein
VVVDLRRRQRLFDVFGDGRRTRHRRLSVRHQHRHLTRGIEQQEFVAPVPEPLLDQPYGEPVLVEDQPHIARARRERMMEQSEHQPLGNDAGEKAGNPL